MGRKTPQSLHMELNQTIFVLVSAYVTFWDTANRISGGLTTKSSISTIRLFVRSAHALGLLSSSFFLNF